MKAPGAKWHPSAAIRALPTIVVSWLMFMAIGLVAIDMTCCGAPQGAGAGSASSGSAAGLGTCSLASLEADVGNVSLLTTVLADLASGNYLAAIGTLIAQVGQQEVGCVVLSIEDFATAQAAVGGAGNGSGSGSAFAPATAAARDAQVLLQRVRDVEARYGIRR